MSEEIKVGDYVEIVYPKTCCGLGKLGFRFVVTEMVWSEFPGKRTVCGSCHATLLPHMTANYFGSGTLVGVDIKRLRKLPPLTSLDEVMNKEELTV